MFARAGLLALFVGLMSVSLSAAAVGPVPPGPLPPGALARLGEVRWQQSGWVRALTFSPDGKALASGGEDGAVFIWDVATGWPLRRLDARLHSILAVAWSADGEMLACAGAYHPNVVSLWNARTGARVGELPGPLEHHVMTLLCSPDRKYLAASFERTVCLWDVKARKRLRSWKTDYGEQWPVRFSADGKTLSTDERILALADPVGGIRLSDAATAKEIGNLPGNLAEVGSLCFSPDGKQLLWASEDGTAILWDVRAAGKPPR